VLPWRLSFCFIIILEKYKDYFQHSIFCCDKLLTLMSVFVMAGTIMMSGSGILTNGKGTRREYGEFNLDELQVCVS